MPDSFGKRNRAKVRERKAEVREERRVARLQRRKGLAPASDEAEPTPTDDAGAVPEETDGEVLSQPSSDPVPDEPAVS